MKIKDNIQVSDTRLTNAPVQVDYVNLNKKVLYQFLNNYVQFRVINERRLVNQCALRYRSSIDYDMTETI